MKLPINKDMSSESLLLNRITKNPSQCGVRPCIRGMRIRVTDILETLAEKVSFAEILRDFPDLELADIQACLFFSIRTPSIFYFVSLNRIYISQ